MAVSTITKNKPNWECGTVQITPSEANTPTKATVNFVNSYEKKPIVIPYMQTTVPGTTVIAVSVGTITKTTADIYITRSNTTTTAVPYVVIDM